MTEATYRDFLREWRIASELSPRLVVTALHDPELAREFQVPIETRLADFIVGHSFSDFLDAIDTPRDGLLDATVLSKAHQAGLRELTLEQLMLLGLDRKALKQLHDWLLIGRQDLPLFWRHACNRMQHAS